MAILIHEGIDAMYAHGDDAFYYLTLYNENYPMPPMPDGTSRRTRSPRGSSSGLYRWAGPAEGRPRAPRNASCSPAPPGAPPPRPAIILADDYGVGVELWSATSYKSLREEALEAERWNRLHPGAGRRGCRS